MLPLSPFIPILAFAVAVVSGLNAAAPDEASNYHVRHGDVLLVSVYQDPDLRMEVRVPADGALQLPLIGRIAAQDRTLAELHAALTAAFDRFIVDPQVTVQVLHYGAASVQVIGQVNRPGQIPLPPEKTLSLLEAIGAAGGFTNRANARKVSIRRRGAADSARIIEIDVDALLSRPDQHDMRLEDGDTVTVGVRVI